MEYRPSAPLRLLRRLHHSIEINGACGAATRSIRGLFRSLKNHGWSGTFRRAFINAPAPVTPKPIVLGLHPFDQLYGTETGGLISGEELRSVSLSGLYATGYLGVPPSTLRAGLAALPIRHEDFSFIDIGCGKGRALLVASEFPFRHLIGVEIAPSLCDVANFNVTRNPDWISRISIVNEDAADYVLPDGPVVLFLYRPFLMPVLKRVFASVKQQYRRAPRPIYILLAGFFAAFDFENDATYLRIRKLIDSLRFIREISNTSYALSDEDAGADPSGNRWNRFMVVAADHSP